MNKKPWDLQGPEFHSVLTPQKHIPSCITGVWKQLLNWDFVNADSSPSSNAYHSVWFEVGVQYTLKYDYSSNWWVPGLGKIINTYDYDWWDLFVHFIVLKRELLCSSLRKQFLFNSCLLQGDHQKQHFKGVTSPLSSLPPTESVWVTHLITPFLFLLEFEHGVLKTILFLYGYCYPIHTTTLLKHDHLLATQKSSTHVRKIKP